MSENNSFLRIGQSFSNGRNSTPSEAQSIAQIFKRILLIHEYIRIFIGDFYTVEKYDEFPPNHTSPTCGPPVQEEIPKKNKLSVLFEQV